jgi:hypothetical protein
MSKINNDRERLMELNEDVQFQTETPMFLWTKENEMVPIILLEKYLPLWILQNTAGKGSLSTHHQSNTQHLSLTVQHNFAKFLRAKGLFLRYSRRRYVTSGYQKYVDVAELAINVLLL